MEIEHLRILVDVAELESFAAVARARDLDPSSVSRIVAQCEADLGLRLFQRTTRRLSTTEAGEIYLSRVGAVVDELDRAREDAASRTTRPVGSVKLSTSVAFGQTLVVPLLEEFQVAFPGLALELMMTDANVDLVRDRVDLAVRMAPTIEGDLVCTKLIDTRYRVCASPDYLARAPRLKSPEDLTRHNALLFSLPGFRSRWLFRNQTGRVTEVAVHGNVVASSALALKGAALAGLGPVLLADWLIGEDMREGRLVDVLPAWDVTATTFETAAWIVYPSRAFLPAKVRQTIDFLRAKIGRQPPATQRR